MVRKSENQDVFKAINWVLWITMIFNFVATSVKLIVGYQTNALSLIADGFDSVFDSASNVVGLIGIYFAKQPADEEHPYGHRKVETMAALIVSMLLFITTWELIKGAVDRLIHPELYQPEVTIWSFIALITSIVIHTFIVIYELREGRRLKSDFLVADAMHTRADIFVSLSVMAGLIAVKWNLPIFDAIVAIGVSLEIAYIGITIIRESAPILLDQILIAPGDLEKIAISIPGVVSSHHVRSRGHESAIFADLHIQVQEGLSAIQAHAISHEVKTRIQEKNPNIKDVTIHIEPSHISPLFSPKNQRSLALPIRRIAEELGIGIHNIWIDEIEGKFHINVHIEVDGLITLKQAHEIATKLQKRVQTEIPNVEQFISHIEPRGKLIKDVVLLSDTTQINQFLSESVLDELGPNSIHDTEILATEKGWIITFYCYLTGTMTLLEVHEVIDKLEQKIRKKIPNIIRLVIHSEPR